LGMSHDEPNIHRQVGRWGNSLQSGEQGGCRTLGKPESIVAAPVNDRGRWAAIRWAPTRPARR